ncbi:MAG: DUF302 domain-containing protein [Thiohalorhabdaceae bacterium]
MYGFSTQLNTTFENARERVTEALKAEGFGVLTEIDVADKLHEKVGADLRPYTILGACNPPLAYQAIQSDPDIGMLLPCNVIVREEADGSQTVGFMDPQAVMNLTDNPDIAVVAVEVRERLERVREALAG